MGAAKCFADRHGLVRRFENADRAGYFPVPDLAFLADVGKVSRHAVHFQRPEMNRLRAISESGKIAAMEARISPGGSGTPYVYVKVMAPNGLGRRGVRLCFWFPIQHVRTKNKV